MKKMVLFLPIFFIFISTSYPQWVLQTSGNGFDLFSASFPSPNTGFACGYGNHLIKTTNSGTNWVDISFPGTASNLNSIFFVNENTGWMVSTDTLFYTTNCGVNWSLKMTPVYGRELFFINPNTGWLNSPPSLYRTTNGGLNWNAVSSSKDGGIFFINSLTGWSSLYVTGGISNIIKSTDGGLSWNQQFSTSDFRIVYSFFFINANTGWATGYREVILKTTNGGDNWVFQRDISAGSGLYSAYFVNENTGWAAGDLTLSGSNALSTTNGGADWTPTNINGGGRMTKVQFANSTTGWIVGQYNRVYKTTNGGITFVNGNNNPLPDKYVLHQNYPNPFNPETIINYELPITNYVKLTVYDVLGKEISVLINENQPAGKHQIAWNAAGYSSGVYYCKLQAGDYSETKKMILLK